MKNILVKTCSWLGMILLLSSILSALLDITVYNSNYIVFYGLSILGLIFGLISWILLRVQQMDSLTNKVGKIGFYGNFAIVILFYPPIYHVWETWIFGA